MQSIMKNQAMNLMKNLKLEEAQDEILNRKNLKIQTKEVWGEAEIRTTQLMISDNDFYTLINILKTSIKSN